MKRVLIALILLFPVSSSTSQAYDSGTCQSLDPWYRNMQFRVEEFGDLEAAVQFAKKHQGQFITDKDQQYYSVIWSEQIPAPATQYQCVHVDNEEKDQGEMVDTMHGGTR